MRALNASLFLVMLACVFLNCPFYSADAHLNVKDNDFAEYDSPEDSESFRNGNEDSFVEVDQEVDHEEEEIKPGHHQSESPPPESQPSGEDVHEEEQPEEESDEFDPYTDEEEFEGYNREKVAKQKISSGGLKITKVPAHLRAGWQAFYMEMLTLMGIIVYAANFFAGKNKNSKLATSWFKAHKVLLEQHFSIVGDDGMSSEPSSGVLVKESESVYTLWCTGRQCCEGMLVELKLLKRHDLVSVMSQMMRPVSDVVRITIYMDDEDMDNFVFALVPKKNASRWQRDLQDLSYFCGDRKSAERYGMQNHVILAETGEVPDYILNTQICSILKKYEDCFDYLHFSDQFVGPKKDEVEEEGGLKMKKPKKVLMFEFKVPGKGRTRSEDMGATEGLVKMVLFLIDRIKTFRLSQAARAKSDKKRREVEQSFLKQLHTQRQEAAQSKREEKARLEKEKLMNEQDPDKQRRMEDAFNKRDAKKRSAKVKSLKVRM